MIDEKLHRILGERTAEDDKKPLKKQQQKIVKIEVRMFVAFGKMQLWSLVDCHSSMLVFLGTNRWHNHTCPNIGRGS